jgi:hypothetical protein
MRVRPLAVPALLFAPLFSLAACGSAADPSESQEDTSQALPIGAVRPGVGDRVIGPTCTQPKPRPQTRVCRLVDTECSASSWQLGPERQKKSDELCCGPAYHYFSGANAGFLGGIVSLCPDTPATREYFHLAYPSGFCNACLPPAPPGTVYAFWETFVGPNCPSGCRNATPPAPY